MDWPDSRDQAHPCRPTISCTADITAPGTLEVEEGTLVSHSASATEATFPVLLKQTFTRVLQLQVGTNGTTVLTGKSDAHYLDNVYFGPKLHLLDQSAYAPSVAIGAQLGLPTFRAYGYARHDDAFFTVFASKDIGPFHVDWNVGATVWGIETSDATQLFTALALSTALSSVVGVAVEGYGFTSAAPFASHDGGARAAMGFTARPWLIVDAGGDLGFFPTARTYSLFLGVTLIPAVFWRPRPG